MELLEDKQIKRYENHTRCLAFPKAYAKFSNRLDASQQVKVAKEMERAVTILKLDDIVIYKDE